VGVDRVDVAATVSLARDVTRRGQGPDDAVGGALGDPQALADVAHPDARIVRDAHQHPSVVGQESPIRCGFISHTHESNVSGLLFHASIVMNLVRGPEDPLAPPEEAFRMLSKIRSTTVRSPAPGAIPDTITDPVSNGSIAATDPDRAPAQASAAPDQSDPGRGSAATERDERRHQRALAREANGRGRGAKTGERLHDSTSQPSGPSRRGRLLVGETVSIGMIGIIVAGLIVGAILGALGASGWVVGLLVATLTMILSGLLRRFPRQR
jgi:hypothetical protein